MNKKLLSAFIFTIFLCAAGRSQQFTEDDRFALTAGIEFKLIQNIPVFNPDSAVLIDPDENFRAVYELQDGFGFGGVIRMRLSRVWNLETGLHFTRRRYSFRINDLQSSFSDESHFRVVAYEIPMKGLVYIQLGDDLFMNVALGASANFFASDVIGLRNVYNIKGFKPSWVRLGIMGSVGVEYRTRKDGYFYVGASWHQMVGEIMRTEVNYFREGNPPAARQRDILDGTYFAIDFRYFINPTVKKKPKVNRVIPDWKNL